MHVITTVGAPRVGACGMTGRPATGGHMAYQLGRPHDIRNRSRDATASEFRIRHSENLPNEGRRSADRRTLHDRATLSDVAICECFGRGRGLIGDRSPLGAPPRRLPRKLMPWLSPGRVSWDAQQAGVTHRPLSQSSEAPRGPVVMPAESIPGPPGSGVASPARRNRTRSVFRCVSRARPFGERDLPNVTISRTVVN